MLTNFVRLAQDAPNFLVLDSLPTSLRVIQLLLVPLQGNKSASFNIMVIGTALINEIHHYPYLVHQVTVECVGREHVLTVDALELHFRTGVGRHLHVVQAEHVEEDGPQLANLAPGCVQGTYQESGQLILGI